MIRTALGLSAAFLLSVSCAAQADEMVRRAGEWEVTNTTPMGPMTQKLCFMTDKSASEIGSMKRTVKECSPPVVTNSAAMVTVESTCDGPMGGKVTLHASITPAGPDAFHSETHMHMDKAPQGMPGDMTMTSDAKRIGPCQPDDKKVD